MLKGKITYLILGIIVVTAIILRAVQFFDNFGTKEPITTEPKELATEEVATSLEDNQKFVLEGEAATSSEEEYSYDRKLAVIAEPKSNSVVSSPLIVKGEAPGYWFFEASFPVKLTDSEGSIIVTEPAVAQEDSLTENFVPYETLLEFNTIATSGYLVLTNDNPSGLPENELSVKIPVLFLSK